MKGFLIFPAVAAAASSAISVAAHGDFEFAGAIASIFGLRPRKETTPISSTGVFGRFLQEKAAESAVPDAAVDNDDDLRAQFEILNTDRYDHLLLEAQKKRRLAEQLRAASDRAAAAAGGTEVQSKAEEEIAAEVTFDRSQADVLEKQADLLEEEASQVKRLVEAVKASAEKPREAPNAECDILKIGPVKFVPQPSELLNFNAEETVGRITGTAFTIHHRKTVKSTFFWEGIELPIKTVADSPNCLSFKYRGNDQVICASSQLARDSWIDAMTEAWFCRNMGIKGTLPSVKNAEKEAKKEKLFPPPPPPAAKKPRAARVNVKVSMDENRQVHVEVNGKEQPVGKHVTINAAEYAAKAVESGAKEQVSTLSSTAEKLKEKSERIAASEEGTKEGEEEEGEEEERTEESEQEEEF